MRVIPEGYRLAVVAPDGTIVDTADIGGTNISRSWGVESITDDAINMLERHIPDGNDDGRRCGVEG